MKNEACLIKDPGGCGRAYVTALSSTKGRGADTLCVTRAWPRRSGAVNEEKRWLCVPRECASEIRSVPLQSGPSVVLCSLSRYRCVGNQSAYARAHAVERERGRDWTRRKEKDDVRMYVRAVATSRAQVYSALSRPKIDEWTTSAPSSSSSSSSVVVMVVAMVPRVRFSVMPSYLWEQHRSELPSSPEKEREREMEVLKTSQEIVHEGLLIKSPPTKLWRAVSIQCIASSLSIYLPA